MSVDEGESEALFHDVSTAPETSTYTMEESCSDTELERPDCGVPPDDSFDSMQNMTWAHAKWWEDLDIWSRAARIICLRCK